MKITINDQQIKIETETQTITAPKVVSICILTQTELTMYNLTLKNTFQLNEITHINNNEITNDKGIIHSALINFTVVATSRAFAPYTELAPITELVS